MVRVNPIKMAQEMSSLKFDLVFSYIDGNYKNYKMAHKKLASLAVQDFDTYKKTTGIQITGSAPMFTKQFWKMAKVLLLDKLRIKTEDEKKLAQMTKEEAEKQKFKTSVRKRVESFIRADIDNAYKKKIDAIITEKTDNAMRCIPSSSLENFSELSINANDEHKNELINSAIKEIPRFILTKNRTDANGIIFNKKFINDTIKNQ